MKKFLLAVVLLSSFGFAKDVIIDGVVYTETIVNNEITYVKKMVPKVTYVTVEKVVMVPAPVTSGLTVLNGSVNSLGKLVTSNRAQIRRVIRRVDRRDD